jgi:hypothetical protein|tara:strand:+ start:299 stop:526 length:228 start_codon:yes stop_codon:yes gene_type:complete
MPSLEFGAGLAAGFLIETVCGIGDDSGQALGKSATYLIRQSLPDGLKYAGVLSAVNPWCAVRHAPWPSKDIRHAP